MSHLPATPTAKSDAVNRAARTLWQGLGIDAAVLIGLGLASTLDSGIDPSSSAFWLTLGGLVIKSVLTAVASFLVRLKLDPAA